MNWKESTASPVASAVLPGRLGVAKQLWEWSQSTRQWVNHRTRWTVSIRSDDRLYDTAHRWFTQVPDLPPRALNAKLQHGGNEVAEIGSAPTPAAQVALYYDVTASRAVTINGHRIVVEMEKTSNDPEDRKYSPDVLYFHSRTREGRDAVIGMLERLVREQDKRQPCLHLLNNWGGWSRRDDLPARTLDSVVLAAGQMERLRSDIERFLSSEADYVRRGQPYHRAYLLSGDPGTGKTSVVRALAAHYGLDLWYAPLGDMNKDASLLNLINEIGSRSILLLEDIDVFHAARDRDDAGDGATLAGLLNALDGVATPHGLITFLNTNDASVLDPALLRPGRVDMREELGRATPEQLLRLWSVFYDRPVFDPDIEIKYRGTTADAMELFKRTDEPGKALDVLKYRRDTPG